MSYILTHFVCQLIIFAIIRQRMVNGRNRIKLYPPFRTNIENNASTVSLTIGVWSRRFDTKSNVFARLPVLLRDAIKIEFNKYVITHEWEGKILCSHNVINTPIIIKTIANH